MCQGKVAGCAAGGQITKTEEAKPSNLSRFLIINPFGIGDVLFTTPFIRAIKEHDPSCVVGYWCNERIKDIFNNNPHIDAVFAFSRGDFKRVSRFSRLEAIAKMLSVLRGIKNTSLT